MACTPTVPDKPDRSGIINFDYNDLLNAITNRIEKTPDLMHDLRDAGANIEEISHAVAVALIAKYHRIDSAKMKQKVKNYKKRVKNRYDTQIFQPCGRSRQIKNFGKAAAKIELANTDAQHTGAYSKHHPYYKPLLSRLKKTLSGSNKPAKLSAAILLRFNLSAEMPCETCDRIKRKTGRKPADKRELPKLLQNVKKGYDMCSRRGKTAVYGCDHFNQVHGKVRTALSRI